MMWKKLFPKFLIAISLLLNIVSCKKDSLNNSPDTYPESTTSRLISFISIPRLFISYIPQFSQLNKYAAYNLNIAVQETALNNNFCSFENSKGTSLINTYVRSTNEIWGTRFDPILSKTLLTKLSIDNKVTTDLDIFYADKLVRKIIGVDQAVKKIYYLEGAENSVNYNKLMRCNWDGTTKEELYKNAISILDAAIDIQGKRLYVIDKTLNALACLDLNTKKIIYQVSNFNAAGKDQKLALQQIKLVPFTIDLVNKKVFWLKESFLNKAKYGLNSHRPDLMVADLDGKNLKNLGVYYYKTSIADDKTIIGPYGFTLTYNKGAINIDPVSKKLYILSQYKLGTENEDPESIVPEYIPTTILEVNYTDLLNPSWKCLTPEKNGIQAFNNTWETFADVLKGFVLVNKYQ